MYYFVIKCMNTGAYFSENGDTPNLYSNIEDANYVANNLPDVGFAFINTEGFDKHVWKVVEWKIEEYIGDE